MNPLAADTPEKKALADKAHADAPFGPDDGKDKAATAPAAAASADDDADAEGDAQGAGKKKKSGFSFGKGLAGLLGVAGAWFISSILGGGWLGTIVFALLAIPGFMIGRQQLGDTFSGWLGEAPSTSSKVQSSDVSQSQGAAVGNDQTVAAAAQLTPQQALRQDVADVAEKSQIARAAVNHMMRTGELNPRRAQIALRNIATAEKMVHDTQNLDIDRLNDGMLKRIQRDFDSAENYLDRTINQNAILAAQIQQSGVVVSNVRSTLPPAGGPSYPPAMTIEHKGSTLPPSVVYTPDPNARWYQPAPAMQDSRPITSYQGNSMANPNFTLGAVLTPEAQMQLQTMRQGGANYQYQQAPNGQYQAPNFNGQPDAGYQAVYSQYK